ncbi:MAG: helix-turn-helix transcriptional regulator [Pseudomonadota bacterium]|nr:helix-turn-helix transcriptional regulator [Pseudomonadota bacterium]
MDIRRVTDWRLPPAMGRVYERLLGGLGGEDFGAAVREGIDAVTAGTRRIYLFEAGAGGGDMLRYHHCEPRIAALLPVYRERYRSLDPIDALLRAPAQEGDIVMQRVQPADITCSAFRRTFFEETGIIERISVIQRGTDGWRGLNVARHARQGLCSDGELEAIAGLARLALPMLPLVRGEAAPAGRLTVPMLEERLAACHPALTLRERQVCARAAAGLSVAASAQDLGIAGTSVVTYRQRAYRRLGVASPLELCRLVAN